MGPGRGSGAGSIILFLIGITDIEPLRFSPLDCRGGVADLRPRGVDGFFSRSGFHQLEPFLRLPQSPGSRFSAGAVLVELGRGNIVLLVEHLGALEERAGAKASRRAFARAASSTC